MTATETTRLDVRISQSEIKHLYDRLAWIYDVWGNLTESRARDRAIELAGIQNGQTVLEVAVGTGLAFSQIARQNPDGTNIGIDISEKMLKKAERRLIKTNAANYHLKVGTAFDLDIESETVDLLVNNYMFDLIPYAKMDAVLDEFKRVLKRNATLILVNMTVGERFGSRIYDRVYSLSPKTMGGCRGIRLVQKLKQSGFTVKQREYYQQLLFPSEVILAHK